MITYKKYRNNKGLTFLDAILSVLVLSIGFWTCLQTLQIITVSSVATDQSIVATQLAKEKVEAIMADKEFKGYTYILSSNYPLETFPVPFLAFSRSVIITEVDANNPNVPMMGSGVKRVEVNVSWGAAPHERVLMSGIVAKY